jgi:geranylgeranylglycerol-phosphate geranylgeranyltransferase
MIKKLASDNNLRSKVFAISDLIKPELPFAAGVCVIAGEVLALGRLPDVTPSILGFLVGFFISGSAMVSNDYFD